MNKKLLEMRRKMLVEKSKYLSDYTIYGNTVVEDGNIKGVGDEVKWNQIFNWSHINIKPRYSDIVIDKVNGGFDVLNDIKASERKFIIDIFVYEPPDMVYGHKYLYVVNDDRVKVGVGTSDYSRIFRRTTIASQRILIYETLPKGHYTVEFFDLTEMFGEGNEPNTVADFKSYLVSIGKMKSVEDDIPYFPYDAGSVFYKMPIVASGKNLFYGLFESGVYNISDGSPSAPIANRLRGANPIEVKSNTTYCISSAYPNKEYRILCYSDRNADTSSYLGNVSLVNKESFTTKVGTQYIRFYIAENPIDNPMLQIEEGIGVTEYAPYRKEVYPVSLSKPLYKIRDIADYASYSERGVWRNIASFEITGDESIYSYSYSTYIGALLYNKLPYGSQRGAYTSSAIFGENVSGVSGNKSSFLWCGVNNGRAVYILFSIERATELGIINDAGTAIDITKLKALLAEHKPKVIYNVTTGAIFEPVDLPKITKFDGIELTTDAEVKPSKVEIRK